MLWTLLGMALAETDEDLVRRAKRGDSRAFGELVSRYQDRVFAQCLRWLGDARIAEDVAQDVFIAAFRAMPRFREEARFSTWIFRITVNHCKNRRLHNTRRKTDRHEPLEGLPRGDDGPERQLPAETLGTEAATHRSEAEELLQAALEQLEDTQRDIILLRDIQDLSYEEIADILELPRGTVKSRLHRARAELARILGRAISAADVFD